MDSSISLMIHLLGLLPAPCLHQLSPYWGLGSPLLGSPLLLWGVPYRFRHPHAPTTHLHLSCASETSPPTIFFQKLSGACYLHFLSSPAPRDSSPEILAAVCSPGSPARFVLPSPVPMAAASWAAVSPVVPKGWLDHQHIRCLSSL